MKEWLRNNQSIIAAIMFAILLVTNMALLADISYNYVAQGRYYHYQNEQDQTSLRIKDHLYDLQKVVYSNAAEIAGNKASTDLQTLFLVQRGKK